ncbi:hypothetical protein EXX47_12035, partial [Escherichia coli]
HADCRQRKLADFLCTGGIIQGLIRRGSVASGRFAFVISLMPGEIRAYFRIRSFYTVNPNIIPVSSCSSRWQCAI